MTETDIAAFVVSSGILDEYRSKDAYLDGLIATVSESPERWRSIDVDVTSPPPAPALEIKQIFEMRLGGIPDEPEAEQLKVATKRLVDYCTDYPDAGIWGVSFCGPEHCYDIFCGEANGELNAICVLSDWITSALRTSVLQSMR